MKNMKNNQFMKLHLGLMCLLCLISIISAGIIFTGNIPAGFDTSAPQFQTTVTLYGLGHVLNAIALACGIYYIFKGSGKDVAMWYKAFVILVTLSFTLRLFGRMIHPGLGLVAVLMLVIVILLLVLSFMKNLGEQRSWILYYALLALVFVVEVITFDTREVLSSLVGNATRLVLIGTIGLALRDKYMDKAARKGNG
ncbi:MAG: hypothetical protein IJ875_04010 [Solobacterium sp.]|nr:hypothetical protein [Solobacterium sp.]